MSKYTEYYKGNRDSCLAQKQTYYSLNRKRILAKLQELKAEVQSHYGTVCQCCGIEELTFLSIDHINNDGYKHRKTQGRGTTFYRWLKRNKYPEGFQVLCHNCNFAKKMGICPHKK